MSHAPRGGARPPHQHRPCSVALASRGRTPSVPLSVCPSASVRSPSAASRGRALVCLASGPAAVPIRCPFRRRRLSVAAVACWTRGSSRDLPPSPAPPRPPAPVRSPERGSGPRSCPPRAGRRVLAGRRPPPLWGGCDGRTPGARVGRPRCGLGRGGVPPGAGGLAVGGGGCGGGGRGGSAALSLPLLGPPRGGGGALRPSWTESVRAIGRPCRGAGRGARPGLPAGRAPSRHPPSPLAPSPRGSSGARAASVASPPRPAFPARPAPRARAPTWLILPVAYACLKD